MAENYNPDVLSCLANLSNDEVFTPPAIANQVLDLLPNSIWQDEKATFLDPVSKTGVFLREIVKRLDQGLKKKIPDQAKRINHILVKQVFGLAITELTALMARRTLYCSKTANGKYSICDGFKDAQGNLRYVRTEHSWRDGRCEFCGANQEANDRGSELETHAYTFIHTHEPEELFNMRFDVIVGNPPYQISDGGAKASAAPVYQKFIGQGIKLAPRYLSMIIPSRWFAGGKGLDEFRTAMLGDHRISKLVDYPDQNECFPGIDLSGGICYFLWERDRSKQENECEVTTVISGQSNVLKRPLKFFQLETFIRYNQAVPILEKVRKKQESSFSELVSSRKPFGFPTTKKGNENNFEGSIKMYGSTGTTYISPNEILTNHAWVTKYKVFIGMAYGERITKNFWVTGKSFLGHPKTCCTETYLVVGPFSNKRESENVLSYMRTRFFRFLVLLKKNTQHATQKVYELAPVQDFSRSWSDEDLYQKYKLNSREIAYIEEMVRPMEI